MSKNRSVKKADVAFLREFRRQRRTMAAVVGGLFLLFVISVAVVGVILPQAIWLPIVTGALYVVGFLVLRQMSKCPYCDEPIMTRFNQQTHCPHCHRPIDPDAVKK